MAQFSKLISFIFVTIYSITWVVHLTMNVMLYIETKTISDSIFNFVLQPTLIVVGFYFGSKTFENISKAVCNTYLRKINIESDIDSDE